MNVASLELSKKLFELSGWDDTDYTYYANAGQHSGTMMHRSQVFDKPENLPAYDLGYLLRRLPINLNFGQYKGNAGNPYTLSLRHNKAYWLCCYPSTEFQMDADTPEDATAKLCIALLEQNIIPRKGEES